MKQNIKTLRFSSIEEFWRLLGDVELAFVVFENPTSGDQTIFEALGEFEKGEGCYVVDANTLHGRAHDYFLLHSPLAKRIDPRWQGKIQLPCVHAVIPGLGLISSAYEVAEVPHMVEKARNERAIFRRRK